MKRKMVKATSGQIDEKDFLLRSKKILDESVQSIDAGTLSKLTQARHHALQVKQKRFLTERAGALVFVSITGIALAVLLWTGKTDNKTTPVIAAQYEDMEIMMADADLELLEELEFANWLLEQNIQTLPDDTAEKSNAG